MPKKKIKIVGKDKKLTPQQELFCQFYATNKEFFGNGTQSYIEAYDVDVNEKGAYHAARTGAWKLLTNGDILKRINEIFEAHGLNDTFVDKQLEKLIVQDADFSSKIAAIKEYNALKKRIVAKSEVTNKFDIKEQDKQTLQNAFGNLVQGVHTEDDKDTDNEPVS